MRLADDVFRGVTFVDEGVARDDAGDGDRDDIGDDRNRLVVVDRSGGGDVAGGVGAFTSSDISLEKFLANL